VGFLDRILPEVERSIRRPGYLEGLPPTPTRPAQSLKTRIEQTTGSVLAEYKRRSPGNPGESLPARSVADFVRSMEEAGATALSCIATVPEFEGSPALVGAVAGTSVLPVLFKDFVVDPIQIEAAQRSGASAILLIARLEREQRLRWPLADLSRRAAERGLEVVLEFHDSADLKLAERVPADVFAVNQRDLDSLRLEPRVAEATIDEAGPLRPLLGFSGVRDPSDASWFRSHGVDGVLVGSAISRARDPSGYVSSILSNMHGGRP
jgi:indole-3-glycerol phosphate synthase